MLGSRKLLIVLCIVPCVLSLVCIGAFAAPAEDLTPTEDISLETDVVALETDVVEDVVKSPAAVSEETFPAQPLLEYSYYSYQYGYDFLPNSYAKRATNVLSVTVYKDGSYYWGVSFDVSPAYLYRMSGTENKGLIYNIGGSDIEYYFDSFDSSYTVVLTSSNSVLYYGIDSTINGTPVEGSLVPDVADSIFDLGDALITFIMSSWVVMIPLAAWLVILCIGAIRKLVKGV